MKIEIKIPELVKRIEAHLQSGRFRDPEDLIEQALDALDKEMAGSGDRGAPR